MGALLLFVTNFLAILLAGGAVLVVLDLNRAALIQIRGKSRRNAYAVVFGAVLIVSIPLMVTGRQITIATHTELLSQQAATAWVEDSDYEVRMVRASKDSVYITVAGHGDPPVFSDLVTAIEGAIGRPVQVSLELVPSQTFSNATGDP